MTSPEGRSRPASTAAPIYPSNGCPVMVPQASGAFDDFSQPWVPPLPYAEREPCAGHQNGEHLSRAQVDRRMRVMEQAERATDETKVGVIGKYDVARRNDPEGKHRECWFFVLDIQHDHLARKALRSYAKAAKRAGYTALHDELMARLAGVS